MPPEFRGWVTEILLAVEEIYNIRVGFVSTATEIGDFVLEFGKPTPEDLEKIENILGIKLKSMNLCKIAADLIEQDLGLRLERFIQG